MRLRVNYAWLHPRESACPIPARAFAAFQKNARRYANTAFQLWVENREVCACYEIPLNVTVILINESAFPEFTNLKDLSNFQAKMDLLRLYVLQQTLDADPKVVAVYADFDIFDLQLTSQDFIGRIDTYGMAFAGSYYPASIRIVRKFTSWWAKIDRVDFGKVAPWLAHFRHEPYAVSIFDDRRVMPNIIEYTEYGRVAASAFENGFIACQASHGPLLAAMIAQAWRDLSQTSATGDPRDIVYFAMAHTLDQWARRPLAGDIVIPTDWRSRIASFYVQYCAGWRLDDNATLIPHMAPAFVSKAARLDPKKILHRVLTRLIGQGLF